MISLDIVFLLVAVSASYCMFELKQELKNNKSVMENEYIRKFMEKDSSVFAFLPLFC